MSNCGNTEPHREHLGWVKSVPYRCPGVPAAPPERERDAAAQTTLARLPVLDDPAITEALAETEAAFAAPPEPVWHPVCASCRQPCETVSEKGWLRSSCCRADFYYAPPAPERETCNCDGDWYEAWLCPVHGRQSHLDPKTSVHLAALLNGTRRQLQQAQEERDGLERAVVQANEAAGEAQEERERIESLLMDVIRDRNHVEQRVKELEAELAENTTYVSENMIGKDWHEAAVQRAERAEARVKELEAERTFLRNYGDQKLPPGFGQRIDEWLNANQLERDKVRWGGFPLGMVRNWIDRAERAEAEAERLREKAAEAVQRIRWERNERVLSTEGMLNIAVQALDALSADATPGDGA